MTKDYLWSVFIRKSYADGQVGYIEQTPITDVEEAVKYFTPEKPFITSPYRTEK